MEKFKLFLKSVLFKLLGFFPKKLPTGMTEFDEFCESICNAYGIPQLDSYKHTIATMIMHHSQASCRKSPHSFAEAIKKAQANEVAYSVLHQAKQELLKKKQAEESALKDAQAPNKGSDEPVSNKEVQGA